MSVSDEPGDEVHPHDFAAELTRQVYTDLDGVLVAGDDAAEDALEAVLRSGNDRGCGLWLITRAALAAHRGLRFGLQERFAEPHADDVLDALSALAPDLAARHDAAEWLSRAEALADAITASEGGREPLHQALARAIYRLYDGLRSEDELLGGRGLMELRTMLAHVDAAAQLGGTPALCPVVRPDRFHDDFLRYVAAAQAGSADVQQPVASLQKDGRITAIVTRDLHPVEHARQTLSADQAAARMRIEALLDFLQGLRADAPDDIMLRASNDNETFFTALVTAAATTALPEDGAFAYPALAQITRYNLRLLHAAGGDARAH